MTVPREPRHSLDEVEMPAVPDMVDSPTEAIPMIPRQRTGSYTAGPAVSPVRLRGTFAPEPPTTSWYGGTPGSSAAGTPSPSAAPAPVPWDIVSPARRRRGRVLPIVLAGLTTVVLGLGIAAATVESGSPAEASSVTGP